MPAAGFTVVVRCADPRLDASFERPDTRVSMGLTRSPIPMGEAYLSNVGGVLPFVAEDPRLAHDIGLLAGLFGGGSVRAVLTAHSLCGGYMDAYPEAHVELRRRQEADLIRAARHVAEHVDGIDVAAYYIDLGTGLVEPVRG